MSTEADVLIALASRTRSLLEQVEFRLNGEGDDKNLLEAAEEVEEPLAALEALLKVAPRQTGK